MQAGPAIPSSPLHTSHVQVETARAGTDVFGQDGKKMVPETLTGSENRDPNVAAPPAGAAAALKKGAQGVCVGGGPLKGEGCARRVCLGAPTRGREGVEAPPPPPHTHSPTTAGGSVKASKAGPTPESAPAAAAVAAEEDAEEEADSGDDGDGDEEEEEEEDEGGKDGEEGDKSDFSLAWEMLEIARELYTEVRGAVLRE